MKKQKYPRKNKKVAKMALSSIPKYKIEELYGKVHHEIMDARISISILLKDKIDKKTNDDLFNILSDLNTNCPQKAIEVFNKI